MTRWEFLIVDVAVDPERSGNFEVDVDANFAPLAVHSSDEMRDALTGHAHYEVVFARKLAPATDTSPVALRAVNTDG